MSADLNSFTIKQRARMRRLARKLLVGEAYGSQGFSRKDAENLSAIGCYTQSALLRDEGLVIYPIESVLGKPYGREGFKKDVEKSGILTPATP